jgi:hypothetical protein
VISPGKGGFSLSDLAFPVLGSAGAVTSWAHNQSALLDYLVTHRFLGLRSAAQHLREARDRAIVDLAGLMDAFGIVSASLLYAGPFEVRPLPHTVYVLGVTLIMVHVWSAFLQAMTDSGWYSPDVPPGRVLLLLRPLICPCRAPSGRGGLAGCQRLSVG